jgi:hypothetical protein
MVQTIQARDISLYELEEKFSLQLVTNAEFCPEWTNDFPSPTDVENLSLERIKSNYLNLTKLKFAGCRDAIYAFIGTLRERVSPRGLCDRVTQHLPKNSHRVGLRRN